MSRFQERLSEAMGARGYENCMRRSVQTVILYEANRCIVDRLPSLRPFQRKLAFLDQAKALVAETGLMPHHQEEIMWRTGTSKEPMSPETAWKRLKLIEKEMDKLAKKVYSSSKDGRDHDEVYREYIQAQYEIVSGQKGKQCPLNWEHAHNNLLMAYRMYFKGAEPDPDFPAPEPPTEIVVPSTKPNIATGQAFVIAMAPGEGEGSSYNGRRQTQNTPSAIVESPEQRRAMIEEIKEHVALLKEFEGVVPPATLNQRKRELFSALPSAPPPAKTRARMSV